MVDDSGQSSRTGVIGDNEKPRGIGAKVSYILKRLRKMFLVY